MKKIIITIDGHSACGKSTLARQLAEKLKYGYIDTGAMYRAVTYYFLENRVNVQKSREVEIGLGKIDIHFKNTVGGNRTFMNGIDVEDTIRKMFVSKSVSHVAAMSAVRRKVVKQQQEMGRHKGIVMEGRDIGTVVFPKAELKIFLTASKEVRTKRRFEELKAKGQNVSASAIQKNLLERDHLDSTRKDSPLKQAKEAILIDNSNLTQKEQLAMILALAETRIAAINKVVPVKKVVGKNSKSNSSNNNNRPNPRTERNQRPNQSNNKPTNRNQRESTQRKQDERRPVQRPNERKPVERKQVQRKQIERKIVEQKPTQRKLTERKPLEQKTVQRKTTEKKPIERKPVQRKTAEKKPVERKPVQRKTAEKKPVVRKPVQRKTAKKKPAVRKPVQKKLVEKKPVQKSKTTTQKAAPKKAIVKKKVNPPKATTKAPAKKAKPKSTVKKSNSTSTSSKKQVTKAKPITKKKDVIRDPLDDFSF